MVKVFDSHQRCARCGWAGITRAHRLAVFSTQGFLLAFMVWLVASIGFDVEWPDGWGIWAIVIGWHYAPWFMWRTNACGGCGERMPRDLIKGSPSESAGSGEPTSTSTAPP